MHQSKLTFSQKILFIDEDQRTTETLQQDLSREHGMEPVFVSSGREALNILEHLPIAIVFTDIKLPDMDGFKLIADIQASHPETVKIILTSYTHVSTILKTLRSGQIMRFIPKPWNAREDLIPAIFQGLDLYHTRMEEKHTHLELLRKNESLQQQIRELHLIKGQIEHSDRNKEKVLHHIVKEITPFITESIDACMQLELEDKADRDELKVLESKGLELLQTLIKLKKFLLPVATENVPAGETP
jgi:response regulator RpfG family c-di-GMP phosphodiesterase